MFSINEPPSRNIASLDAFFDKHHDTIERIGTFFENITEPSKLPVKWRRIYLITLPVSFPLHIALLVVLFFLGLIFLIVGKVCLGAYEFAQEMWDE